MLTAIAAAVAVAAVVAVIYFIWRAVTNGARLEQTQAALDQEMRRRETAEKIDAEQRAARLKEFNDKAAAVTTLDDAIALMREAIRRSNAG